MHNLGFIGKDKLERALEEELNLCSEKEKFRAPHFCDFILKDIPLKERRKFSLIQATLDYSIQKKIEHLVKFHIKSLETKGISNAAVVVLDNKTGNILSMVGSKDFFDSQHDGQVNGAVSLRQPGSTLKPFTYALALEKGMTAATILEDTEIQFITPEGIYRPQNYDRKYHGPIRIRSALACSYNVPAVSVLQTIGPDMLYRRLRRLHFESLKKSPSFYGIGLTLGNGEVTLLELVRAYSALARGGVFLEGKSILMLFDNDGNQVMPRTEPKPYRVFSPHVTYIITHILADRDARIPSFGYNSPLNLPFPCASKTGTSKDFRDNWTVGYSPKYTVGVWVGNFDGKPMHNVSGITGCGPLFRDIMLLLGEKDSRKEFEKPEKLIRLNICPLSGKLSTDPCPGYMEEIFVKGTEPQEFCSLHNNNNEGFNKEDDFFSIKEKPRESIKISFPLDGDIFKIDPILRKEYQVIYFKASLPGRVKEVEWWLNNRKIGISSYPFSFSWTLKPGFYTIKATVKMGNKRLESQPIQINVLS